MAGRDRKIAIASIIVAIMIIAAPANACANPATLKCVKRAPNNFVCLTIDDGFSSESVKKDLYVLRANHIRCTFFVIGSVLAKYPDLWRQAVKDGNEIAYHTMNHVSMSRWSNARIVSDLNAWIKTAKSVLGPSYAVPKFVRLPGGNGSSEQRILKLFKGLGYRVVYWSSDTLTGAVNRHRPICRYIETTTKTGTIILTHFNSYDAHALPKYVGWLKAHYKLGTLTQAFATPAAPSPRPTPTPTPTPLPAVTADPESSPPAASAADPS